MFPGIAARASGPLLQHDNIQFITHFRLGCLQFHRRARRRMVQTESGFNANHQQIKHIRQAAANLALAFLNSPSQPEIRRQKSQRRGNEIHEKPSHVAESRNQNQDAEQERNYNFGAIEDFDR